MLMIQMQMMAISNDREIWNSTMHEVTVWTQNMAPIPKCS
jgi:hypothetical protein